MTLAKKKSQKRVDKKKDKKKRWTKEDIWVVNILRWLTGNNNISIKLSRDSRHWEVLGWQNQNYKLEIEMIYITAQKEATVTYWCARRGAKKTKKSDPKKRADYLPFVKIISQEECQKKFGISFVEKDGTQLFWEYIQPQIRPIMLN